MTRKKATTTTRPAARRASARPNGAAAAAVPPPFIAISQPPPANVAPGAMVTAKAVAQTSAPTQVAVASLVDAATGMVTPLNVVNGPLAPQVTFPAPAVVGAYVVIIGLEDGGVNVASDSAPFSVP